MSRLGALVSLAAMAGAAIAIGQLLATATQFAGGHP